MEKPPQLLETQPAMEIVSDDVILPVIESSVISRTKEQYADMDPNQKRDFWLAVSSTVGGVALTAVAFAVEKHMPSSKLPTVLRGVGYSLDYADGFFAKRTATPLDNGAGTELGAIADPLADKFNNTLNEIALVQNRQLQPSDLAIRAIRDTSVTAARRFATKRSGGRVDVKANKFGKLNTVVRDGVNLFASTQTASQYPRVNRALQTGANIYSIASGLHTTNQLIRAYRKESTTERP
jgi:phosphatidylglycerophosphate synthase